MTALTPDNDGATDLINVRLTAIRFAAKDTSLFEFRRVDGKPLPSAEAGAHIDLHLPNGLMRQYSLVEAAEHPAYYIVGIKRDPKSRGGSSHIHDDLRVGTTLQISAPRNNFPLNENAEHTVLIAGGIGITPIWCMLNRLEALGRSWSLYYSCRARSEAAFLDELHSKNGTQFHFDEESPGKFIDLSAIVSNAPKNAHFYCCGPLPMLAAYEAATASLPREQMHIEYFTSKHGVAKEGGFTIELASSGKTFEVPAGKTILQVLRDAGFVVPSSCEQGVCGACETRIISGEADHRDAILTESERAANITMMICCSGAKSERLVLDL
jgi:ferredoxin-NADP reductase